MTTRIRMAGWIVAAVLAVGASAETFHSEDGVVFEGTIRQAVSGAAVCNVLEEKYSAQEYERLKGNQGRPLHLWQVDFAVRNESGRPLDYLRASAWVRSEQPPCTNWSGEGPGGGPVRPESDSIIPTVWADYYKVLPMPNGMRRDQQERSALYLLVFEGQRPRFGEWDIDYRFAGAGGPGASTPPAVAFELPPEIQADRYLRQAEQAVRDGDAAAARAAMERLEALQAEHGLKPAPEDHYRYAQAWEAAGEPQRAMAAAVRYLQGEGRESEHYTEALDLLNRAESGKVGPAAGLAGGEAKCEGQAEGAECWKELASHPGCHVWDNHYYADQTVTWTGGCAGGLASGTGTLTWVRDGKEQKYSGLLRDGKEHGRWVLRLADGGVQEGPYVDGKMHGRWVLRLADGGVQEGPFVDGKKHGRWVLRLADGGVQEGPYVDGKKHGPWVLRWSDGEVDQGPFVDGKKHGRWVERFADGTVQEGPYVDGKRHGRWVERFADGTVQEGPYVDGKRHGRWVFRLADGSVHEGPYVDGKMHGRWVLRGADGGVAEGPCVDGKMHGPWVLRDANGRVEKVRFVNGERQ